MARHGAFRSALVCTAGFLAAMNVVEDGAVAQVTSRVSVSAAGVQATGGSRNPSISGDGRFVAFDSTAWDLVPGDTNGVLDVFVRDRLDGFTIRVSRSSGGVEGDKESGQASISSEGRFVAFHGRSSTLVPDDTNKADDIFVHDTITGMTERASVSSAGVEGNDVSIDPSISSNGDFVAFESFASNLVTPDTNASGDILVRDRLNGITRRVSVDSAGNQGDGRSASASISASGRFVAFNSIASNLVPGDTNDTWDVFVHDMDTGITERASVSSSGAEGNARSGVPSISEDGRLIAFWSLATNLVVNDTNGKDDVFVHDRATGVTERVSINSAGREGNGDSQQASISADGRFVSFESAASDLVPGDTNGVLDVFVHDRATDVTQRASVSSAGLQGNDQSLASVSPNRMSADGSLVAFYSFATDLVSSDTNGASDVFVRELRDVIPCRAGTVNGRMGPIADVLKINNSSGDGNRVVTAAASTPIDVSLDAAPLGPGGVGDPRARYTVWVWRGFPSNPFDLSVMGRVLGCTVDPSPLRPLAAPQPLRCIQGTGMPRSLCGPVVTLRSAARAPWTFTRVGGVPRPGVFTIQGLLEDDGAANALGFSVTNAVVLVVQ